MSHARTSPNQGMSAMSGIGHPVICKYRLSGEYRRTISAVLQAFGLGPLLLQLPRTSPLETDRPQTEWRYVMKKFIAALALGTMIAVPALTLPGSAADVSLSSPAFGDNGY